VQANGVVLLTCEYPPFPGGIGSYCGNLVREVRNAGFATRVVAPRYPELPTVEEEGVERLLAHHKIPATAIPKTLSILRSAPANSILLAADIRSVILARILSPIHRRPYRVMIHGSEVAKLQSRNPVFALARSAYLNAEMLAANSQATLRIFEDALGAHRRAVVTYLGVAGSWFEETAGNFEQPELAALPADAVIVCTVGRIEDRKGHLQAVAAVARARDFYGLKSPVFVVAGRPEDSAYLAAVLEEARRCKVRVVLAGVLSEADVKRLYKRAACLLLAARTPPGRIEGFGLVVVEAGAQGCPTVATRVGGIPEALGPGGTLVELDDPDGMARSVAAYAHDAEKRARDGAAARLNAARFSWAACARKTFPELPWPQLADQS
jgi:phosphatidylinositol alpha-1,6-mannosyltransferase